MKKNSTLENFLFRLVRRFAWNEFSRAVLDVNTHQYRVFGDASRLSIHPTVRVNDAFFNVISGHIRIAENAFFGHGVSVITGRHIIQYTGERRGSDFPREGSDIIIGEGAWIGSNATILGPCKIGRNAVVGAMSLVRSDVPENSVVAGVPTRIIRTLQFSQDNAKTT